MKVFKFVVGSTLTPIPSDPRYSVANCAAVVIAESREAAIDALARDLATHGDVPWHEVATVTEFDPDAPGMKSFGAVVMVVQL